MTTNYMCSVLIVDNAVTNAALQSLPNGILVKVVDDMSRALQELGIDPDCQKATSIENIQHNYDIVLLDFRLEEKDMRDYPMGGLTLHSLFKASFNRSKRGQCIVCCYSDKMGTEFPKARYIFDLAERKLRNQDGAGGLHQSGIGGIDWPSLYRAKADSILFEAPFEVFAEIVEKTGAIRQMEPWDQRLPVLANFLGVSECGLNQLLFRSGSPDSKLNRWLNQWLWRKSLSASTTAAYKALQKFTHLPRGCDGRQLDRPICRNHENGSPAALPFVVDDKGRECCIPEVLADELEKIAQEHLTIGQYTDQLAEARCRQAKKAFRMILTRDNPDADNCGYTIDDLLREHSLSTTFNITLTEWKPPAMVGAVYLYIPRPLLGTLLQGLPMLMHNHSPVVDVQGRVLCEVRIPEGHRKAMFVVKQQKALTSSAADNIAKSIGNGKQSGLFPTLASWGALWVGCEGNAVWSITANFALNLGLGRPVLAENELAVVLPYETV